MPFRHLIRGAIPILLALAGAVVLAVAVMPGAALAASTCTGVEVGRATWVTTDSNGNRWLHTQITYRQPSGIECSVWLVEAYTGGSGGSDPTTNQLTTKLPGTPPPDTPPWQTGDSGKQPEPPDISTPLGKAQYALQLAQAALEGAEERLPDVVATRRADFVTQRFYVETTKEYSDAFKEQFGVNTNEEGGIAKKKQELGNALDRDPGNKEKQDAHHKFVELQKRYEDAKSNAESAAYNVKALDKEIKKMLETIAALKNDVEAAKQKLAQLQQQQAKQQVKAGLPPDLEPRDWMSHIKWWSTGSLSRFDDNNPANTIDGVTAQAMIGGDIILQPRLAIGFGIGTNTSDNTTAAGTSSDTGLDLQARGFWGLSDRFWFDATASYGYSRVSENNGGVSDDFDFHRFGFGAGANISQPLAPHWRFNGRLGWAGSLSRRVASTDSGGTAQPATNGNFGQARADARFAYLFDGGEVFADGALRLVTNDSTDSADTFDGELGGGVRFDLGNGMTLTGRGYAVVGHDAYEEYGALVRLTGAF